MTMFHPEMNETPPEGALIHVSHVINDTYDAAWSPADESAVLAIFRDLRIHPKRGRIFDSERLDGTTKRWVLITGTAHSKLVHRPDVAAETLLD